jgi:hypothetical protein
LRVTPALGAKRLGRVGVKTVYIEAGSRADRRSARENEYCGSFNGELRDELLNVEILRTLLKAQVLVERWRRHCNAVSPHSAVGYRPPAPLTRTLRALRTAAPIDQSKGWPATTARRPAHRAQLRD